MRTTIELSDATYRALRAEGLRRGVRGFSPIVEEALVSYLEASPERERLRAAIAGAEGSWSDEDVSELESRRAEVWSTWQTDRFSTQTS
jgi:hypothetical protein